MATDALTCTCTLLPGARCPVPHGVWIGASFRLGSGQPVTAPYPHICTGPWPVAQPWRDCPACVAERSR